MPNSASGEITELLQHWSAGDRAIQDRLFRLIYDELHRIASGRMRSERPSHTLQPTALVHEAYLRLVDQKRATFQNRAQFLALASGKMRLILVDHARARHSKKRNLSARITLDEGAMAAPERAVDVLDLNEALESLAAMDGRKARVVECRIFGGMTIEETAEALGVAIGTVISDFRTAKAWLKSELGPTDDEGR